MWVYISLPVNKKSYSLTDDKKRLFQYLLFLFWIRYLYGWLSSRQLNLRRWPSRRDEWRNLSCRKKLTVIYLLIDLSDTTFLNKLQNTAASWTNKLLLFLFIFVVVLCRMVDRKKVACKFGSSLQRENVDELMTCLRPPVFFFLAILSGTIG